MRDIFYTVVVIWLVYKIWQAFSQQPSKKYQQPNTTTNSYNSTSKNKDDDEYVDYEEIKD